MLEATLDWSAEHHHHAVTAMVWAPANAPTADSEDTDAEVTRVLFTASRDSTIRSWHVAAPLASAPPRPRSVLHGHAGWVTDLVYIPQHHRLASGSLDKRVKLWTPDDGRCIATAFGHDDYIHGLACVLLLGFCLGCASFAIIIVSFFFCCALAIALTRNRCSLLAMTMHCYNGA